MASYIRPTRTRPLVVKLHGDHRLSPQNTIQETEILKEAIEKQVRTLLHDRGLIFIGYGGNDQGIKRMVEALPNEALPLGVFWVGRKEPEGALRPWLEGRNAIWVERGDFDEMMLLVRDAFNLPHPERRRFEEVFEKYMYVCDKLSVRIVALPDSTPEAPALKEAVRRIDETLPEWWAVEVDAGRLRKTNPVHAEATYEMGVKQFPTVAPLLASYADFLAYDRQDYERAEEYFRRAVAADPNGCAVLTNYAAFLTLVRKDYDRAEEYHGRAILADPHNSTPHGNHAISLLHQGRRENGEFALKVALSLLAPAEGSANAARCWFYAFVFLSRDSRGHAIRNLRKVLEAGGRSPGWDFSPSIIRAREEEHPDVSRLEKLAAVVSGEAHIGILDAWDEWKKI